MHFWYTLHILHITVIYWHCFSTHEADNWTIMDHATRTNVPLRADCWFEQSDKVLSSGDFAGIRINIWNYAKI